MRLFYLLFLLIVASLQNIFADTKNIDRLFNSTKLNSASYCIYAIDAKNGAKIFETEQKSLSTASVMKLFTTAVALEQLGADFTFSTSLWYSGKLDPKNGILSGDLILKGGCDPAFYSSYFPDHYKNCFENWIEQLKLKGVHRINGNLLLDLSAMPETNLPGGWCWDDIGNYYGAGVSPLTYSDNLYEIHFSSAAKEGILTSIQAISPEITGLHPDNRVKSSVKSGDHTIIYCAPGSLIPRMEGTIPMNQTDFVVKGSIPDPAMVAGNVLLAKINSAGLAFKGKVIRMTPSAKPDKTLIAEQVSPPLKELIVPLDKESLNLFAEHLLCEIGRKNSGVPTLEKGLEAYNQFCKEKGIDSNGFFPNDGSGLSRSNALTAKTLVETIQYMYQSKDSTVFFNALPIAGLDGTLKNSFKNTPLEKNVVAKTGSMERVRSLAGKMTTKNKKTILFAILINNFDLTSAETSKLLESILLTFYEDDLPGKK